MFLVSIERLFWKIYFVEIVFAQQEPLSLQCAPDNTLWKCGFREKGLFWPVLAHFGRFWPDFRGPGNEKFKIKNRKNFLASAVFKFEKPRSVPSFFRHRRAPDDNFYVRTGKRWWPITAWKGFLFMFRGWLASLRPIVAPTPQINYTVRDHPARPHHNE